VRGRDAEEHVLLEQAAQLDLGLEQVGERPERLLELALVEQVARGFEALAALVGDHRDVGPGDRVRRALLGVEGEAAVLLALDPAGFLGAVLELDRVGLGLRRAGRDAEGEARQRERRHAEDRGQEAVRGEFEQHVHGRVRAVG
jgi:hypothetical protein